MASFFTPAQRRDDEEGLGLGDLNDVRQQLFYGTETPFMGRSSILNSQKQPVQVFLRIRPKNAVEVANNEPTCLHITSENVLLAQKSSHAFKTKGERSRKNFMFSHIFSPDASQKEVFEEAVLPTLNDFLAGQNCLVFSYGVTNSGKSYTVTGKSSEPGVLPRTLDVIFNSIGEHQFTSWDVKPKHYANAHYLTEAEKATEREIKEGLLNKVYTVYLY